MSIAYVYDPVMGTRQSADATARKTAQPGLGKKLEESCVRFTKLANLPVDLIGEALAKVGLDEFLDYYGGASA